MTSRSLHITWVLFVALGVAATGLFSLIGHDAVEASAIGLASAEAIGLAGLVGVWLARRRQAGPALVTPEPLSGIDFVVLFLLIGLLLVSGDTVPSYLWLVELACSIFAGVQIVSRLRVCERGLQRGNGFMPWARVLSYDLAAPDASTAWNAPYTLTLRYRTGGGVEHILAIRVSAELQPDVLRVFSQHVAQSPSTQRRSAQAVGS